LPLTTGVLPKIFLKQAIQKLEATACMLMKSHKAIQEICYRIEISGLPNPKNWSTVRRLYS